MFHPNSMSSLDNECADLLEPVGDIPLLGGVDARHGYIGARVERLAVRLTVSTLPQCTPSLCGEGWDIAILRIRSTCTLDPRNVPCIPPIRFGTTAATLSREVVTVGHGDWPGFDRREEWHLDLEASLTLPFCPYATLHFSHIESTTRFFFFSI